MLNAWTVAYIHMLQGLSMKQLSYIVDPCVEHTPTPTPASRPPSPAKAATPKSPQRPATAKGNSQASADKGSRSLIEAFQQDVIAVHGKGWEGITGNASFVPTDSQYEQLLRAATGVVYCGMGHFLNYIPAAVVAGADMTACQLAVLLDRAQTAQSLKRQPSTTG